MGMLLVHRPRTAPFAVLVILILEAIIDTIRLIDHHSVTDGDNNVTFIVTSLVLALVGTLTILIMSLRDPEIPPTDISAPMSRPTAALRSPEDNLTLWQFMTVSWMTPLIRLGYKRQLEDEDVWQLGYEFQHQRLHENFRLLKGTVIQRLIKANIIDLIILTFLGILELFMQFSGPLLLQRLLSSMEDATAPKTSALRWAALAFAVRVITAQSGVFSLWYGRRCYERSRGEMITMLYEKALNRKIGFVPPPEDSTKKHANGSANGTINRDPLLPENNLRWWQRASSNITKLFKKSKATPPVKEPASMGKILNLMRNDVYEVAQRFWEFQAIIQKPLSVVFSVTLVVRLLGWPSLLAVLVVVLAQGLNALFARIMIRYEKRRRLATDKKLSVTSQWIEAIRHLRWYGWQDKWLARIMEQRQKELNLRIVTSTWNLVIGLCNSLALGLTPVIAFFAYTVIAGKPLRIDIAFPAMQVFQMLTTSLKDLPNLIIVIINAWVAVGRIEDYMAEPDRGDQQHEATRIKGVVIDKAKFAWPGSKKEVLFADVTFRTGVTLVCGEVASGKTALLQAILGEMELLDGTIRRRSEALAYCAQTPWLQSMSIRQNILFGEPWDEDRYNATLEMCALDVDVKRFTSADLSLIGENGIGLSGGQRARVALARAIYSRAKILLLDDPLAALDQKTAQHVVDDLFEYSKQFTDRTIILVTHRTDLVARKVQQIVTIRNGKTEVSGPEEAPYRGLHATIGPSSSNTASNATKPVDVTTVW